MSTVGNAYMAIVFANVYILLSSALRSVFIPMRSSAVCSTNLLTEIHRSALLGLSITSVLQRSGAGGARLL